MVPTDMDSSLFGKLLTCSHFSLPLSLFHNPERREPKNRIFVSFGSTASRSPLERPHSLPPILMGMSVRLQVLPRSLERNMAPLPAQLAVYMPTAKYTLFASFGSGARLSIPRSPESAGPSMSVIGVQVLSAGFQRYAPPMSVRV